MAFPLSRNPRRVSKAGPKGRCGFGEEWRQIGDRNSRDLEGSRGISCLKDRDGGQAHSRSVKYMYIIARTKF